MIAQPHPGPVLRVGRDRKGHWIVQHSRGLIEGIFVSRQAALQFARQEAHGLPGTRIAYVGALLTSTLGG